MLEDTLKDTIKALRIYSKRCVDLDTAMAASWLAKELWLVLMEVKEGACCDR